ncbi:gliding motility-associated C-terminal domain-containing protein [Mucilaginibacter sp. CAU 1740]|uniref:gliding motility-associated C-terminal domain-containing protein n=1 Tax=Mucilaginibacter sp. CAU 1740 TaxID=3140365 RepID=UPI00325B76B6
MTGRRILLFITVLLFISFKSLAAVFTVTSNADSGPGTLREALTLAAANGSATKDYINFNLPDVSEAGRTIILFTQLPDVTGNVIIDGTTQPGTKLGVSDAKVIIKFIQPSSVVNIFNLSPTINQTDTVEFYGLYITCDIQSNCYGIVSNSNCKLIVGAPSKGNVITNTRYGILGTLQNGSIRSNFIGLAPDGVTPQNNQIGIGNGYQNLSDKLIIGGDQLQDGNIILDAINFYNDGNTAQSVTIKNNSFGTDYTGKKAVAGNYPEAYIVTNAYFLTLNISKNVFAPNATAVSASNQTSAIIKGNFIGVDRTGASSLGSSQTEAIMLNSHVDCLVGGDAPEDSNIIANYGSVFDNINFSNLEVIKNSFRCNRLVLMQDYSEYETNYVRIIKLTDNQVSGDAPPGAKVQLYYSTTQCNGYCNPDTWFATITANSSGIWVYNGPVLHKVMVTSTVNHNTFGVEPFHILPSDVTVTNIDCHHLGSIKLNEQREGKFTFTWTKDDGTIVGHGQSIDNLQYGSYKLDISEDGTCPTASGQFNIADLTPHIDPRTYQLDCNTQSVDFDVYDRTYYGIKSYTWTDKDGNKIGDTPTLKNMGKGVYYLSITDNNGCTSETVKYEVFPPADAPVIDESLIQINDNDCGAVNGSIKGIKLSNYTTGTYGWATVDGSRAYYNKIDLENVPAGTYYFFVNYTFNCTVQSTTHKIKTKNGITINETQYTAGASTCNQNNGFIKGITATGATSYKWINLSNNSIAGTNPDLTDAGTGTYQLTASNDFGCSAKSLEYTINAIQPTSYPTYTFWITNTCPGQATGSVSLNINNLVKTIRWIDANGQTAGTDNNPQNLKAGTYKVYFTDANGCETLYPHDFVVSETTPIQIAANSETNINDQCGLNTGGIKDIQVTGGTPPYTYTWTNEAGTQISTLKDIAGIGAGTYTLQVNDAGSCGALATRSYAILNENSIIDPPVINPLQLCAPRLAQLSVNSPQSGNTYRLYNSITGGSPLDEQPSGVFSVNASAQSIYYISSVNGTCESSRTLASITISLSAIDIPNAFTPNGDGKNDYWKINGAENYPQATVQIFTRAGMKVFESKGYSVPFDGNYKGNKLPGGVYYYVINLGKSCKLLSGNLTILR